MIEKLDKFDSTEASIYHVERLYTKVNELIDFANGLIEAKELDTNKIKTTEIPDTEYVTINEDDVYVGGKVARQYNGEDIYRPYLCVAYFKEARDIIRKEYGYELLALHCLQSSTEGEWAKTGNPTPDKDGIYSWVRAVYKNKEGFVVSSLWAFGYDRGSAAYCASNCTYRCGYRVQLYEALRAGLFGSVAP